MDSTCWKIQAAEEMSKAQEDQNQRRAVVTGLHDDTTEEEEEVQDLLSYERNVNRKNQIKCPAKPITHAFLQSTDNDERDKFVRSAHILRKKMRGYHWPWTLQKDFTKKDWATSNAAFIQDHQYRSK